MKYVYIRLLTGVALFICFFIALLTLQDHVLFYQEQHYLFLFTTDYFRETIHADGLLTWLGAFVIQFYHIPWLGATIVAGMLTSVYLMTESIIRRFTGLRDLLQIGAAGAVALYFTLDGIDDNPGLLVMVTGVLLIVWIVALIVGHRRPDKPLSLIKTAIPVMLAAAYILGGFWWEMRSYNRSERAMIRAERAVKQADWDAAIAITDQYLSTGRNNKLMLYLRNIALAEKGILLEHMFDFPMKPGVDALAFPWRSDSREAEYGHKVHEITGNINAAHHWAFEAMTVWGETAPHLLDLARYNVALGRPKVAQRFVNKLNKSLFYRGEAMSLQRQIDGTEAPEVHYAFAGNLEERVRFINVHYPARDLMEIVKADPDNGIARQYLQAVLLAANDQEGLISVLQPGHADAPVVEEAKLIYSLHPQVTPLQDLGLSLTDEVTTRYGRMRDLQRHGDLLGMESEFGKTFWFYIYNYCPYGAQKRNTLGAENDSPGSTKVH